MPADKNSQKNDAVFEFPLFSRCCHVLPFMSCKDKTPRWIIYDFGHVIRQLKATLLST